MVEIENFRNGLTSFSSCLHDDALASIRHSAGGGVGLGVHNRPGNATRFGL